MYRYVVSKALLTSNHILVMLRIDSQGKTQIAKKSIVIGSNINFGKIHIQGQYGYQSSRDDILYL